MDDSGNKSRRNPGSKIIAITGGVFLVLYLILGILFLVVDKLPFDISNKAKTAFGIILIVYAFIRFRRILATAKKHNETE